jgi:hypothetical protein
MQLDDKAAAEFMRLLGRDPVHEPPGSIRLRAFPHSETPAAVKKALGARKFSWGDRDAVEGAEAAGLGIYVTINPGGDTKASITHCIAYFAEFDDIPKDQQLAIVAEKMPPASIIVDTGGDSLHFYWILSQPCGSPSDWQADQKRIAKYLGSDPSINDPSRVMRLPGAIYYGKDQRVAGRAAVVDHQPGLGYGREELMSRVPAQAAPLPPSGPPPGPVSTTSTDKTIRQAIEQLSRVPARIPGTGTRHVYLKLLWALAELTGAEEAARIFVQHSPAWAAAEDLHAKAEEGSGAITHSSFFHVVKQEWGITRPARTTTRTRASMQPAATEQQQQPPKANDTPAFDQARIKLKDLLADGLSGSALATKVLEIANEYDCYPSALHKMVQELQSEDDATLQADAELEGIRKAGELEEERKTFTLEQLVPKSCVEPLRYLSTSLQVDDLATAMIFLTCASATVRAGTRIWGDELTFAERPQIWLGLVGKSGLGKSPAMRNLGVTPTHLVKRHYHHRNQERQADWLIGNPDERGPEPQPFVFQVSNYTAGAIVKQFAVNEVERLGVLLACDELAALFSSLNEFQTSGKGSEQEQLLSLFDNNGDAQIRVKDGYRTYDEAQLSIIGGIQPLVFDQLASRGDPAGLFARLLLLPLPTDYRGDDKPSGYSREATRIHQDALEGIAVRVMEMQPVPYRLSRDAEDYFQAVKRNAFKDAANAVLPAHSNIYGKRAGYVLRIAGIMHILRVAAGEIDPLDTNIITLATVKLAEALTIHLQSYALSAQTRAAMAAEGTITELMRTIHRYALDNPTSPGRFRSDALTPAKRKLYSIQTINSYIQRLVDAGLADWLPSTAKNGGRQFICKGRVPG